MSPGFRQNRPTRLYSRPMREKSLASNTAFLLAAQLIRVSAQAGFIIVLRRYWGPAFFGDFSVAFVLAKLVTQLADLGLSVTVLREASQEPGQLGRVLGSALGFRLLSSLGVLAVLAVLAGVLPYPGAVGLATVLFGVAYLLQSVSQLFFAAFRSRETVRQEPLSLLVQALVLAAGTVWAACSSFDLAAVAAVYLTAQLAGMLWIYFAARSAMPDMIRLSFEFEPLRRFWTACRPIALGAIGYLIYYQSDTILIYFLRGNLENGIYNTAYQLVAVCLILPVSFFNALMPRLVKSLDTNRREACRLLTHSSELMLSLGLPLGVGTLFVASGLLDWLYPQSADSVLPLKILVWMAVFSFWGQSFTHASLNLEGARPYMRLSLLGALVNTGANLVLIPFYGYLAACWTTLGTELLINGLFYLKVRQLVGPIPLGRALWRPLCACLAMALVLGIARQWTPAPGLLIPLGAAVYGLVLLGLGGGRWRFDR
jgi:O-antigen/teichoic acid export membrane protein